MLTIIKDDIILPPKSTSKLPKYAIIKDNQVTSRFASKLPTYVNQITT
jgi:hypothetical protein